MTHADHWTHRAPAQWTRGRLKNLIASAANGTWGSEPEGDSTDVHCIRAADFNRTTQRVDIERAPLRSIDTPSLRNHQLQPGDLVLEKSGGGENQPVGMAVLFEGAGKAVCSNFCARISPEPGVDPRFLAYTFAAAYDQGLTQSAIKQTTGIQNLDSGAFFRTPWAYPGTEEQTRIADFLDAKTITMVRLDSRIEIFLDLLSKRQAALLANAFSEDGSNESDCFQRVLPLRRIMNRWIDYRGATPEKTASGVPLVTAKNIRNGSIDLSASREYIAEDSYETWMRRGLPRCGDVLLTTEAPLGQVAVVVDPEVALAQRIILLRTDPEVCSPEWLYWYLRSPQGQAELQLRATGSTALGIKADRLRGVPIPLVHPALAEQRLSAVRSQVDQIELLRSKLAEQRSLLAKRRQALITAAVTGQFDVSSASGRNVTDGV